MLGDSLSSAYGMEIKSGWVSLLQQRLDSQKLPYKVINASISGDTAGGGVARLPRLLAQHHPDVVVIELGGNDGLRGLAPEQVQRNLSQLVSLTRRARAKALLVGIQLPPNYGTAYTERFHRIYVDVAGETHVPLVPNLVEGLTPDATTLQSDGLHPAPTAQPRMLENVWAKLKPLL